MIKKPKQNDLPTSFENEAELQNVIRENKKFFNAFYSAELKKTQFAIIREAVSGSTFRAYRGGKYEPSSVYRTWAQDLFEKNTFIELTKIDDIVLFDKKLKELENDLNKYWKRKNGVKLRLCYAYKLIDLLFKMLPLYKNFTKEEKGKLLKFLHVPLDKYTLNAIRIIWNKRIMNKKMVTKKIPLIPSMSFIGDDYDLYLEIQKVIRESIINAYPIEFDLAVWNRTTEDFKFALVERKTT